jgi:multidrug efflux system membrane fusion protein
MSRIAYLVGSGVLVVIAGAALGRQSQATVHTVPLNPQNSSQYDLRCELQPAREVTVIAPASGIVREVTPKLGDQVRPLTQLARMDDRLQQIAVKRAAAQVKAAGAALKALQEQSASAVEIARAEAALAVAEADKEEADYWLGQTTVFSPIPGQITEMRVHEGQYVRAGQPLLTLTDYEDVVVWMPWDALDAKRNAKVQLFIENQPYDGRVEAVVPVIPAHRRLLSLRGRLVTAVIGVENKQYALRPGQKVYCPLLPVGPLVRLNNKFLRGNNTVYVLRGTVVRFIPVRRHAAPDDEHTVVSGAFLEGDELITSWSGPVRDGAQIDPKNVRRSS